MSDSASPRASALGELPRALADLYGADPRGRWMLQRAGLLPPDGGGDPLAVWTQVTLTAMLRGRVGALLDAALKDAPGHPLLERAAAELRARRTARRRRRLAWFFGLGVLLGGAMAVLTAFPGAGQLRGRVLGLDPSSSLEATIRVDGCLRPEPLTPQGQFTLACPRLDREQPAALSVELGNRIYEGQVGPGGGEVRVGMPVRSVALRPPRVR